MVWRSLPLLWIGSSVWPYEVRPHGFRRGIPCSFSWIGEEKIDLGLKVGGIVAAFEYFAGLSRKADAGVDAGFRLVEGDAEPSAAYVDAERCDGRLGREVGDQRRSGRSRAAGEVSSSTPRS